MFGWFAPRSIVTPGFERWCDLVFAWLAERDGQARTAAIPLFRPTVEDFPAGGRQGHDLALHFFTQVKERCGMADWPCRLVPQGQVCGTMPCNMPYEQQSHGAAGTFQWAPTEPVITYDPALLRQPVTLIATFAHELGHGLLAQDVERIPGGAARHEQPLGCTGERRRRDAGAGSPRVNTTPADGGSRWEEATDLMAIHRGWGLFQLRSTQRFVQTCCGFGVTGGGYLTRAQCAHALALFCRRQGIAIRTCADHLDGESWRLVKRAARWLERRERDASRLLPSA